MKVTADAPQIQSFKEALEAVSAKEKPALLQAIEKAPHILAKESPFARFLAWRKEIVKKL